MLLSPPISSLFPYTTLFRSEFLKGYFCTHFSYDFVTRIGKLVPRLRFYASYNILDMLNKHLHKELDTTRSEEHTSELQSRGHLVCRLLLEKKNKTVSYPQLD